MQSIKNALLCAPFKLPTITDKRGYNLTKKSRTWGKQSKTMMPGNTTKITFLDEGTRSHIWSVQQIRGCGENSSRILFNFHWTEIFRSLLKQWAGRGHQICRFSLREKTENSRAGSSRQTSFVPGFYSAILVSWDVTQRCLRGTMRDIPREKETNADSTLALARLDLNVPERECCIKKINSLQGTLLTPYRFQAASSEPAYLWLLEGVCKNMPWLRHVDEALQILPRLYGCTHA